jgi:hypothetical protein
MLAFLDAQAKAGSADAQTLLDTLSPRAKNSLELFNEQVPPTDPLYNKLFEERFRLEIEIRMNPANSSSKKDDGTPKDKVDIINELKADLAKQTEILPAEPLTDEENEAITVQQGYEINAETMAALAAIDRDMTTQLLTIAARKGNRTEIATELGNSILEDPNITPEREAFALDMMIALATKERFAIRDKTGRVAKERRQELNSRLAGWIARRHREEDPLPKTNTIDLISLKLGANQFIQDRYKNTYRNWEEKLHEDMKHDPLLPLSSFVEASISDTGVRQSLLDNYESFIQDDKTKGLTPPTKESTFAEYKAWEAAKKSAQDETKKLQKLFKKENFNSLGKQAFLGILMALLFKLGNILAHPDKAFGGGQQQPGMASG